LACELAAYFYLELGEINKSVEYFLLAHERYHEWVSSQVDFVSCVLYNFFFSWRVSLFVDQSSQREQSGSATACSSSLKVSWNFMIYAKGAIGKCNDLFEFVDGVWKNMWVWFTKCSHHTRHQRKLWSSFITLLLLERSSNCRRASRNGGRQNWLSARYNGRTLVRPVSPPSDNHFVGGEARIQQTWWMYWMMWISLRRRNGSNPFVCWRARTQHPFHEWGAIREGQKSVQVCWKVSLLRRLSLSALASLIRDESGGTLDFTPFPTCILSLSAKSHTL